jgi:uncharacterized protein YegJ (DUF2314 family)
MRIVIISALMGAAALVVLFLWWRFFYVARPEVPPLVIDPNDPLMQEAVRKAKDSIPRFRELAGQASKGIRVKVPFVTSTGTTEHLWAEVLSFRDSEMDICYLTPPVTHNGRLMRLHTHPVSDLTDWQVELPSGRYAGGFTMRVLFVRGREQWESLPPELAAEEEKYD